MVRVTPAAAAEEVNGTATATATDGAAKHPSQGSPSTEDSQEKAKDTQLPHANAAAPDDASTPGKEPTARKAVAQDPSATTGADAAGGPSNGENNANGVAAAATGANVDSNAPHDSGNNVDDSLSGTPREAAANNLNVPTGGEGEGDGGPVGPLEDEEEELSIAGGDDENSAATSAPATSEESIAITYPTNEKATYAPKATLAPPTSPVVVVEVTSVPLITPAPATTKPLLRAETNNAAVVSGDPSTLHARLNQGSPLLLISFAVICCGFLILWVRKRKINGGGSSSSDGGAGASGASSSSKVQYSRIENKKESPFEGDDGDDDDDDRGDNWDDWEGDMGRLSDEAHVSTNAYQSQSSLYSHPNPFAAGGASLSPPISPELVAQSAPPQFQFAAPPRLPAPGSSSEYHNQPQLTRGSSDLHEIVVSSTAATAAPGSQKATSPGSNSSSDSYEVVTDDPVLLHSSPFTSSKKLSPPKPSEDLEKQQAEDDLFSQFGMVPTFRKSTQQSPSFLQSTPPSSSAPSHRPSSSVAPATAVTAASASALFAAEMEDLSIGAASDEWGEDDEWVQGI